MRASFGRAASKYDAAAIIQHEVFERMFARLDLIKIQPTTILDAGCGTGWGQNQMQQRYKQARLIELDIALPMLEIAAQLSWWKKRFNRSRRLYVCADIESLPIQQNSVDMVWSNLAIQWCNDIELTFGELHRSLRPNGLFMFSTFGPDTLMELRMATGDDSQHTHVSHFLDMHDIGDALVRSGFSDPVLDVEHFTMTYDDVLSLMRDLKTIGAQNATEGRQRGLQGKSFLRQLTDRYEKFRHQGKLPATYEVVYGHAWKSQTKLAEPQSVIWHHRK